MSVLLRKSQTVPLAPNDMTKQGLLDCLANASRGGVDASGRPFDYHYMDIIVSEMSNFMSQYDKELAGVLTDLFDNPPVNEEQKRGLGKESKLIPFPGLSMLLGTATENLGATVTTEMWGSGFMARVILVYSCEEVLVEDLFQETPFAEAIGESIILSLRKINSFSGPMAWTEEAAEALRDFYRNAKKTAPLHHRLANYTTRRWLHLAKLVMIAALSEERMEVTVADFLQGLSWLTLAENEMPEIFKDMQQHEDGKIYEDLRRDLVHIHMKGKRNIHVSVLARWLSTRVAAHSVPRMLEVAEQAGYIIRVAGTSGPDAEYIPQMNATLDGTVGVI